MFADLLGREVGRLADIAILWDDIEDEILRILDRAAGDDPTAPLEEDTDGTYSEEFAFELTPTALAYIAAHEDSI